MSNLFAYGTLLVPEIWRAVVGREFPNEPAELRGYEIRRVANADFPGILPCDNPANVVTGRIFRGLDNESLRRLDAYEDDLYERIEVTLSDRSGNPVTSETYVIAPGRRHLLAAEVWILDWFMREAVGPYLARLRGPG